MHQAPLSRPGHRGKGGLAIERSGEAKFLWSTGQGQGKNTSGDQKEGTQQDRYDEQGDGRFTEGRGYDKGIES